MRVVGGSQRGRQIVPPKNFRARPTTDFAKENLFNILQNQYDLEEVEVLDLFSGTGSISYEFASRGAKRVVSVELNPVHQRFISKTAVELGFGEVIESIKTNVFVYLKSSTVQKGTDHRGFDIVFADPPYDMDEMEQLPGLILENGFLKDENSIFILEHSEERDFSNHLNFWQKRSYGSVQFTFFRSKA